MDREKFCDTYWNYYLVLEKDFLKIERFITFDLGDNFLYDDNKSIENYGNSLTYSVEFIKQYQAICSEVDVILKAICEELGNSNAGNMIAYTSTILNHNIWMRIVNQKVKMKNIELYPFKDWRDGNRDEYNAPHWWPQYNDVKHHRAEQYKEANLKNVLNALAGLYILENYLVKYIGDMANGTDVPNDISHLFEMVDWETRDEVLGRETYNINEDDVSRLFI